MGEVRGRHCWLFETSNMQRESRRGRMKLPVRRGQKKIFGRLARASRMGAFVRPTPRLQRPRGMLLPVKYIFGPSRDRSFQLLSAYPQHVAVR